MVPFFMIFNRYRICQRFSAKEGLADFGIDPCFFYHYLRKHPKIQTLTID
jgi:hypothetical protein